VVLWAEKEGREGDVSICVFQLCLSAWEGGGGRKEWRKEGEEGRSIPPT
jgi:hypothetical protein